MLAQHHRLGPYEVLNRLGAGGMGEVYRARDTRLQRDVAIKIIAPELAADPAVAARFEREARAVAALSHPNILAIHDIGRDGDVAFVVTELLEGHALDAVLTAGPIPVRTTLALMAAVAGGLAAAHDRGVVHRDIKPSNLFVRSDGRPTILDFGLACQTSLRSGEGATVTSDTGPGVMLGTVGYMAPEQVRGQAVDHRADIFAVGTVLYEMVSGRRAFVAPTAADTLSAILHSEPADLPPDLWTLAPPLEGIILRCLAKDPAQRFQSTSDLAFALDAIGRRSWPPVPRDLPPPPRRRHRVVVAVTTGLLAGVALLGLATSRRFDRPVPPPVVRFEYGATLSTPPAVAVSPDGLSLAWSATSPQSNRGRLFHRRLADPATVEVADSEGVTAPAWRDTQRLAALRDARLVTWDVSQRMAAPSTNGIGVEGDVPLRGVAFNGDDVLLGRDASIVRLAAGLGAEPIVLAAPDRTQQWLGFPQWLSNSRYLYMALRADGSTLDAMVRTMSGTEAVRLSLPEGISRVLVDADGHLVYGLAGNLLAQRFDLQSLTALDEAVTIGTGVAMDRRSGTLAADIGGGVAAYRAAATLLTQFEWRGREGQPLGVFGAPGPYFNFDLSPDATRIAAIHRTDEGGNALWVLDARRKLAAVLRDARDGPISDPAWSPDGTQLAYRRGQAVVVRGVSGGPERVLAAGLGYPDSWSPDGRMVALGRPAGPNYELWAVPLEGGGREQPIVTGLTLADEPRFSPDGRWVAYHARLDARPQVFVVPFPPTGEVIQLSAHGGVQPRWRGDGQELYFLDPAGRLMVVDLSAGPGGAGESQVLFDAGLTPSDITDQFAVTTDGQRFLIRRPIAVAIDSPVKVIVNWRELLRPIRP